MKLVPEVPVIEIPVESALALTYSKFVTVTVSPVVWSVPDVRLTAVTPPAAASTSQSLPLPASIDVSVPRIGDGVVATARADDVGATAAVDGIDAAAGRDVVGRRGARHRQAGADGAGIEVLEVADRNGVAGGDVRSRRRARLTAERPDTALTISVLLPVPPSMLVSAPQ